jgi:hypothetical protein
MVVSPLSPAGVVDRREIIYSISLAVARRFGVSPGTVQHFRGRRGRILEPVERNDWFDKHRKPLPPGVWIKGRGYVVHYDNGGLFDQYKERWSEIGMKDDQVEVLDHCASGCTMITMYIPKDRLCFGPNAYLAFHMAGTLERPNMEITKWMVSHYPQDIRIWLEAGGAPEKMTVQDVWKLPASELWKMGYRKCND